MFAKECLEEYSEYTLDKRINDTDDLNQDNDICPRSFNKPGYRQLFQEIH